MVASGNTYYMYTVYTCTCKGNFFTQVNMGSWEQYFFLQKVTPYTATNLDSVLTNKV